MSNNPLDLIQSKISIVDVIKEKIKLTKKGKEYTGLCPFHGEKTPSFWVNPSKELYYCFGCGAKGNIVNFIMEINKFDFQEALTYLAEKAGIELTHYNKKDYQEKKDKTTNYLNILSATNNFYIRMLNLPEGKEAHSYLINRGLSKDLIQNYKLGFAPQNPNILTTHLKELGFLEKDIIDLGLRNSYDNKSYDFLTNRVTFPIFDIKDKVIAFSGRSLKDELPKYKNSKESEVFIKSNTLYGLNLALSNLKKDNNLIIVEGYLDVISLAKHGFNTSISPMGTSITKEQINTIHKYDKSPIYCLDGDTAGQKATLRILDLYGEILITGMLPKFIFMPKEHDPDSYLVDNSKADFTNLINNALPISEVLWQTLTKDKNIKIPEIKSNIEKDFYNYINNIKDTNLKNNFIYFFQNKIKTLLYNTSKYSSNSKNTLDKRNFKQPNISKFNYPLTQTQIQTSFTTNSDLIQKALLICCIYSYPSIYQLVEEKISKLEIKDSFLENQLLYLTETLSDFDFQDKENTEKLIKNLHLKLNLVYNKIDSNNLIKFQILNCTDSKEALILFNKTYNSIWSAILKEEFKLANYNFKKNSNPADFSKMIELKKLIQQVQQDTE